jgi:hypothetical protein
VHVIREDPDQRDVLWAGTEFGLYLSHDGGAHWHLVQGGLPRVPIHDLDFNAATGDLIVATHARGVWILDNARSLASLVPARRTGAVVMLPVPAAEQTRRASTKAHAGDMLFRGENPAVGARVDIWSASKPPAGSAVIVRDVRGAEVLRLPLDTARTGLQRVLWNLRHAPVTRGRAAADDDDDAPGAGLPGRWVTPGTYRAELTLGGTTVRQTVAVAADPAVTWTALQRIAWEQVTDSVAALVRGADSLARTTRTERDRIARLSATDRAAMGARATQVTALADTASELLARVSTLYGSIVRVSALPTADQRAQHATFRRLLPELRARWAALGGA